MTPEELEETGGKKVEHTHCDVPAVVPGQRNKYWGPDAHLGGVELDTVGGSDRWDTNNNRDYYGFYLRNRTHNDL